MRKLFLILIVAVLLVVIILFLGSQYAKSMLNETVEYKDELIVNIPKNTSVIGAVEIINDKGYLKPEWFFKITARIFAKTHSGHIYSGYYRFESGITKFELIENLFDIKSLYTEKVPLPIAGNYKKYAEILSRKIKIDKNKFIELCESDSLLKARNIRADNVEGYIMPETYTFFVSISAAEALDILLDYHEKIWNKKFKNQGKNKEYSKHQLLTLASIINAESGVAEEQPVIGGLYHNRLNRGMLLQADPTVQFSIGEKRRLLYKDLEIEHPYNTYVNTGLPPAPINCPSLSAIDAAVNPVEHDFLFMVAIGDGSGRHNFSENLTQHQIYVNQFRKKYRNNKQK